MDKLHRAQVLCSRIKSVLDESNGQTFIQRLLLIVLGAIPTMGAFADLSCLFLDEDEKAKALDLEKLKLEFMQLTLEQLEIVAEYITGRLPTKTHLALLLSEVLGNGYMEQLRLENHISVVLNDLTREEFKPFEEIGWVAMHPLGSVATMGSGNRVGSCVEEVKRPYGIGTGFIIVLKTNFKEQ
jgi:hypothetical protein